MIENNRCLAHTPSDFSRWLDRVREIGIARHGFPDEPDCGPDAEKWRSLFDKGVSPEEALSTKLAKLGGLS